MRAGLAGREGIALAAMMFATHVNQAFGFPTDGLKIAKEPVAEFYADELPADMHRWPEANNNDDDEIAKLLAKRWDNDCVNPESQRRDNMAWNRLRNVGNSWAHYLNCC